MDENTIAEMRARATAAKERIDAVEEGEVDEPEFDEVVAAAAMFANDAAKLAEDVDALTKEVERLTKAHEERESFWLTEVIEACRLAGVAIPQPRESAIRHIAIAMRNAVGEIDAVQAKISKLEHRLGEAGEQYGMARFEEDKLRAEVERLTKTSSVWESERRRIEGALDAAGLYDVETTLTSRVERTCEEVVNGRQVDKQIQAFLDVHESDFDVLRGVRPSPLVRIEKLADERDKLKAEVERLRASREEARGERDEFGRDVERLAEERAILSAKIASLEPLLEALRSADRQELPRDLADRVTAHAKAQSETHGARPQSRRLSVYDEIRAERAAQDAKWGGPSHDDTHNLLEWVSYLFNHAARALGGHVHVRSEPAHTKPIHWTFTVQIPNGVSGAFRRQMTRVAALAVAAIESHDRAQSTAVPSAHAVTS